jgi:hypothetical protein
MYEHVSMYEEFDEEFDPSYGELEDPPDDNFDYSTNRSDLLRIIAEIEAGYGFGAQ